MTDDRRPPYGAAAAAAALVLLGYLVTLAPTVTFWDAGELVAAARSLGIPHPPGTPLWVLVAHTWGKLVPFGDYAWRLNLMSAVAGATAAGLWFLVTQALVRRGDASSPRWVALGAGLAAALLTAFGFTNWQNAVEAEVYSIAMITIAGGAWCAVRWTTHRGTRRGDQLLLVLLLLGAMSIGNHLLALLVGPALVLLLAHQAWRTPLAEAGLRRREQAQVMMVAATWVLLIALGLGSATLTLLAGVLVALAAALMLRRGQVAFVAAALGIVVIGLSPYLFLLLRARQGPFINEADPATWDALLAVIRRAQYPIRTPLDDPTVLHGPANPGRTLTILGYQLANYAQYFDWQWARTLGDKAFTAVPRLGVTLLVLATGMWGALTQWRRDRAGFWMMAGLFGVTGLGLVLYMNFKPGPSIGFERWPSFGDHEVRERDYFFVASFVAWGVWTALGLAAMASRLVARFGAAPWTRAIYATALLPFVLNFRDASRAHGPDATLARDVARAFLDSVPPGGILFTYGDNDTFPLWHAQVVDGYRPDVILICLALAETDWYQRQIRAYRSGAIAREQLPAAWRDWPMPEYQGPVHELDDAAIRNFQPMYADQDYELPIPGGGALRIPRGTLLAGKDMALFAVLRANAGRRPVAWALTASQKLFGAPVVQHGLALVLEASATDSAPGAAASAFSLETTERLMRESWSFGRLLEADLTTLEPNVAAMARTIAVPYARVGLAHLERGDTTAALAALEQAARLAPGEDGIAGFLAELRRGGR